MNLDEETEEAVRRQRAANCPIRAFLDALPEASPETLKNLNELETGSGHPGAHVLLTVGLIQIRSPRPIPNEAANPSH